MKNTIITATFLMMVCTASAAETDKTLVSWVTLTDTNTRSGSILTIQRGPWFDGIIWAERAPGKWMAGSNAFHRTEKEQQHNRVEQADAETTVQLAIVYRGDTITIYRNGEVYTSYMKTIYGRDPK